MSRNRVLWYLLASYFLVLILSLGAVGWQISVSFKRSQIDRAAEDLKVRALLATSQLQSSFVTNDFTYADSLCRTLSARVGAPVTIFLPSGKPIGSSENRELDADIESTRPEVKQARLGQIGTDVRFSRSLGQEVMFVALPAANDQGVQGIVRMAFPVGYIDSGIKDLRMKLVIAGLLIGLLAIGISVAITFRIARPIETLKNGATLFAAGDLDQRLPVSGFEETRKLAAAMNDMAEQLDRRIRAITHQRNEQEAVLASMIEGVIAVDADERVMNLNRAAAQLLRVPPEATLGRTIQEVVRNTELQKLMSRTLASRAPVEGEFILTEHGEQFIQVHGAQLPESEGKNPGAVIVLHDITALRRLENLRRDFVANVSHELKTPITSIKGFVETLRDGAVEHAEDARRFLGIIEKHVDRLNNIIEDLLTLSRIEQGTERAEILLEDGDVCEVLRGARDLCLVKATEKRLTLEVRCDTSLRVRLNPALLEQAVVNLIDNAVKYSEPDRRISISASEMEGRITIEIRDEGCGVAAEHLSRLWERFYRVDRARSRSQGGTGLGLAIVKHIALAHGGNVSVDSIPGQGSTFRIHLPSGTARP
ncbi:MAG: ATP-binding protein [Candidatus Zixiibacteriota bacterium]